MTLSELIPTLLNSLVDNRVYQDGTPAVLVRDANNNIEPFILWSVMGGRDADYVDQTMGDKSNARVQLQAIASDGIAAETLIRQARDKLLASAYTVGVYGSPVGTYDSARGLRGRFQQFSIWFPQ
jgi:hypothetical protein